MAPLEVRGRGAIFPSFHLFQVGMKWLLMKQFLLLSYYFLGLYLGEISSFLSMLVGGSGLEAFIASHLEYIEVIRKPRELAAK